MDFVEFGRHYIEQAAGGNAAWTKDVNFGLLLAALALRARGDQPLPPGGPEPVARPRYSSRATRTSPPIPPQCARSEQTSVPTGRLQMPELDMHTISDQLVPVQQENYYRHTVTFARRSDLLRQAFVQRQLHCNFTPSELVAGVQAIQRRVQTGRWDHLSDPSALNAAANATGLGSFGAPAFIPYEPGRLSGDNGPFDPFTGGSFPFPFGRW